jgi:hypothetical protein
MRSAIALAWLNAKHGLGLRFVGLVMEGASAQHRCILVD